jgi:predicted MFS family arabinose efflux permease
MNAGPDPDLAASRRRIAITVNATVFVNFLAFLGLTPLYAQVAHDLGTDAFTFGQYFLIQGLINVLLQIPVGTLADRYGRRPVMVVGLVFMTAGQLLRWQSYSGVVFLAAQVCIGLCGPFIVSASYALIADAYTSGRAQALGILQASINLGQGAGFLFAGVLSPWLGWRGYSLVVAMVPVLLLPLIATQPLMPMANRAQSIRRGLVGAFRYLALPPAAALAVLAALNLGGGSGSTYLAPFVAAQHHTNPSVISLLLIPYLVGSVVGGPVSGRMAEWVGLRAPALISFGLAAAALLALALFGYSLITEAVCLAVVGATVSSLLAITAEAGIGLAMRTATPVGAALGGLRIGQGLGPTLAPAAVGFLLTNSSAAVAYLLLAACMAVGAGLMLFVTRGDPGPSPGLSRRPT